ADSPPLIGAFTIMLNSVENTLAIEDLLDFPEMTFSQALSYLAEMIDEAENRSDCLIEITCVTFRQNLERVR
ncbi:hypothetical protein L9F63_023018, partial [Diploptera punctata]